MDLYQASLGQEDDEEPILLTIEEYEETRDALRSIILRADAVKRLNENDDFQTMIVQGYLTDEPVRLANLMASGKLPEKSMENCLKELDAIGRFRNFLKLMVEQGSQAEGDLVNLEEAREEAIEAEAEAQS